MPEKIIIGYRIEDPLSGGRHGENLHLVYRDPMDALAQAEVLLRQRLGSLQDPPIPKAWETNLASVKPSPGSPQFRMLPDPRIFRPEGDRQVTISVEWEFRVVHTYTEPHSVVVEGITYSRDVKVEEVVQDWTPLIRNERRWAGLGYEQVVEPVTSIMNLYVVPVTVEYAD